MNKASLGTKILLMVLPIALLGLFSLSFVAYNYVSSVIEKELSSSMLASLGKSAESINRWLATIMLEPETIASTPAAKRINEDFAAFDIQNINRHKTLHRNHPDIFQDIYAANRLGEYHTIIPDKESYKVFVGDIANRPYFISIMEGGPTQITPPLISRTTGIPTIFVVAPILDDNLQPQGLIGAGISLKYIQQIALELKAGQTGYGFIIARDGTYISHPDAQLVMQHTIAEKSGYAKQDLGELMMSGKSGMYRYQRGDSEMVAFYQPIPITGWSVATVLPAAELFAPATKMMRLLGIITFVFLFIIGTTILLATRNLVQPLRDLAVRSEEISRGNLDGKALPVTSTDEIGILSLAFNRMANNLRTTLSVLQRSEDKYRSIFENSVGGLLQTSVDGKALDANPAMAKLLGFTSTQEVIDYYHDLGSQLFVDPADRQRMLDLLLTEGEVHNFEARYRRVDDQIIWVSISALLVRDEEGNPHHIEGQVNDISDKKSAEKEKEKLFEQLIQAQKLEAVGQLAGGVAHDFNNMLAVILGRTQLALLKLSPNNELRKSLKEIQVAAEHSANLTRQLLAFARKQTVSPKIIDINRSVGQTHQLLKRLIPEDIELVLHLDDTIWPIFFDPDQIGQMLTNMCVNARDAIQGTGQITIETKNHVFDADYCANYPDHRPGEYVCLMVSDTGSGMDQNTQKHIFEPFFTTKELGKGTGLGLSTVYGIVKQNNGFIHLYSEPSQGTTFKICIPRHSGEDRTSEKVALTIPELPKMAKVLVVEDEARLLAITSAYLEELGCAVLTAHSALEAIVLAKDTSHAIDLLITDVVMPQMNGSELTTEIRKLRPELRCLYMSGYTADIIAHKGVLDIGVNFIQKPFSLQALATKIREIMETEPVLS